MRRRLLLNLLLRPLLILWVQLDLALVHCPSIDGGNLEGETNKQTTAHAPVTKVNKQANKQVEVACVEAWMQGAVQSCIACGVQCAICQYVEELWRCIGDALEKHGVQYAGSYSDTWAHQHEVASSSTSAPANGDRISAGNGTKFSATTHTPHISKGPSKGKNPIKSCKW